MLFHKLRFTAVSLLLLAAVATGAGTLSRSPAIGDEPVEAKQDATTLRAIPGRMTVVGRVLDPQGKEVPGASVMVYGAAKQGGGADGISAMAPTAIGQEASDRSGHFRIDAPGSRQPPITKAAPLRSRPATGSAGSTSTSMPISLPPTSRSDPNR